MATRPALLLTTAALLVGAGTAVALAATGDVEPVHALLVVWLATSYAGSGLIAWAHRPANLFGPLMIVTGFGVLASALIWSDAALPHTIGQALDLLPLVLIVHVSLAFPDGRLRHGYERVLIGIGYTFALGAQLVVMMLGGPGSGHLLTIADVPAVADPLHAIELLVISGVALTGAASLVARRRTDGRPLRRSLALLIDASFSAC